MPVAPPASPYVVYPLPTHPDGLPLVIETLGARDPEDLIAWITAHHGWVRTALTEHGALLFRGFALDSPQTFERVARAVDPNLKNEYLGTSPRNALTPYVFTASELPSYYPIPQHCEMSFVAQPPERLFFCCLREPRRGSGETPLADFRRVLADLDPALVARFEERGLRIVRNYSGPSNDAPFDLWRLKRWDEMFGTTDRDAVAARCEAEGFTPTWTDRDGLRLLSTQPVLRTHPTTGEHVWHNHSTTFHLSQAAGEYRRIFRVRPTPRHWFFWQLARALERLQRRRPVEARAMECSHLDGSEIASSDMEAVRDAVWRHLVVYPWRTGDLVAIDNYAVSHGRLPYRGPREIAVAWA